MSEPVSLPHLIGEVALDRRTEDGGRRFAAPSGYRVQALLSGVRDLVHGPSDDVAFNDCPIYFDAEWLLPGGHISVRIYPLAPEYWTAVRPGDTLGLYEGSRLVGRARIDRIIDSGREPPETAVPKTR